MGLIPVRIDHRFCGPPQSGNGGYTCGLVASVLEGAVEVTLRAPPPLDTELTLASVDGGAVLRGPDGSVLAEGKPVTLELALPQPVSFEEAERASPHYIGFREHPYPGCFVCGPARAPENGPGLGLFAGAVTGQRVVAAPWQPARELCDASGLVRKEFVWASLDCPSWFGHAAFAERVPTILLGRLTANVLRCPASGERCVVQGWGLGQEGRRILCGSALFGEDGACLAYARATWVELKGSSHNS
jgi:hypothetical protein